MDLLPSVIVSDRLLVRQWRPEDAAALHDAIGASIEHLRPWMSWISQEPMSVADRRALIERWEQEAAAGGDVVHGVWERGALVGSTGLHRRVGPGGLEIGYWVHVDHVGRGVATEVARLLTDAAFTAPDVDQVEIHHDIANTASARVPAKLGYRRISEADHAVLAPAETGTDVLWRTTRDEWAERSAGDA